MEDGNSARSQTEIVLLGLTLGKSRDCDNGNTVRKYCCAGGVRVAMRTGGQTYYLLSDHLGSTNVTANSSGVQVSKLL